MTVVGSGEPVVRSGMSDIMAQPVWSSRYFDTARKVHDITETRLVSGLDGTAKKRILSNCFFYSDRGNPQMTSPYPISLKFAEGNMKSRSKRQAIARTQRRSHRSGHPARARTSKKTVLGTTPASIAAEVRSRQELKHYPVPWRVFIGERTNELAEMQESALDIVAQSAHTAVSISQYLFGS